VRGAGRRLSRVPPDGPKAVLVTGASSGIGRRTTERLAGHGGYVHAGAVDIKALSAIPDVQGVRLDVTSHADSALAWHRRLGQRCLRRHRRVDVRDTARRARSGRGSESPWPVPGDEGTCAAALHGQRPGVATNGSLDGIIGRRDIAVEQALFDPALKRRHRVVPQAKQAQITIWRQVAQLVERNEGQPYAYDCATRVQMLDEALVQSRPRTK
jgi:hypothetical protein